MKLKTIFLTLLMICGSLTLKSQSSGYKAKYIASMLRYINWPENANQKTFKVAVFGSFEDYQSLSEETLGLMHLNKNIEIVNLSKLDHLSLINPQILIIAEQCSSKENLIKANTITEKYPTLIVSSGNKASNFGAGINFIDQNGRLGFELILKQASRNGIQLNRQIQNFALRVQ